MIIGTSLPLTGPLQAFGTTLKLGYEQAVNEMNAREGILVDDVRCRIELIVRDNASDGEIAAEQVRSLVNDSHAVALLGPATPQLSIPVSTAAEVLHVPVILTITPVQAWKGGNPAGWKYAWDVFFDEIQMTRTQFQAADLIGTNRKVALFTDTEEDGVVMGGLWEETSADFGYEIAYHAQVPVDCQDFHSQVEEARASGAEVVVSQVTPPSGVALLEEMRAQDYVPQLLFLEKAGNTGGYVEMSGGLAEGSLAANWFAAGAGLDREQEFIDAYAARLGGVTSDLGNVVAGYSIARVLLEAIERAGSRDADAINAEIARTHTTLPAGKIQFGEDQASALPAVQTRWVGHDQLLVLDAQGLASTTAIAAPMPGLATMK